MNRRTMLKLIASGSTASLSALAGCVNVTIPSKPPASGAYSHEEYTLGAKKTGWRGIAPKEVREDLNPEIKFRPGKSIRLHWKTLDSAQHKVVIENSLGETLHESETVSGRGETRTLTFESTQEMTTYLCPYYPVQMRGVILCTEH